MNVRELMRTDVITASPAEEFKDLVERMLLHGVSCLPVVDDDGHILGILSETDLLANEAYEGDRRSSLALVAAVLRGQDAWLVRKTGHCARDLMTRDVLLAHPDDDVRATARRLLDWAVNHMPVVEHGRLVGIVSRQDLLQVFRLTDHEIHAQVTAALEDPDRAPADVRASVGVRRGIVSVVGSVAELDDVERIRALVRSMDGVIAVKCDLAVRGADQDRRPARAKNS